MEERLMRATCVAASLSVVVVLLCVTSSCGPFELAGKTVVTTGRLAGTAVKTTGKFAEATVKTTGKVIVESGKVARASARYYSGKKVAQLEQIGDAFTILACLNRRYKANLLLDSGASSVQISPALARRMGVDPLEGMRVKRTLADGAVTYARQVVLKEVNVGGAQVKNVPALVLEDDAPRASDGLLGMSFLNHFDFKIDTEQKLLALRCKR